MKNYAPIILRIGIAFVFLWFGLHQIVNPNSFLGYVPSLISDHEASMTHNHPLQWTHNISIPSVHFIVLANGIFETILGIFLVIGLWTRIVAILLALHLFGITLSLGYNDIAVRDFGLLVATVVVSMNSYDGWCLDYKRCKK